MHSRKRILPLLLSLSILLCSCEKAASASTEIVELNPVTGEATFVPLAEEATVEISIHLDGGENTVIFSGYISAIDLDFPSDGYPTMSIYCLDCSHVMNRKKKKRSWENTTNAEVVKAIAKEYGFKCVVEQGYTFKTEEINLDVS